MSLSVGISIFSAFLSLTALFVTYNVSVATQRAFVFINQFQTFVLNDKLVVMPKWINSGSTPTKGMISHINWKADPNGLPKDFDFPDINEDGKKDVATFIGPKGEQFGTPMRIPLALVDAARNGKTRIFIWGWTTYKDVFWLTAEHTTRFCNELEVTGLDVDPETKQVSAGISFKQHDEHNCIDGECK